MFHRRIAAFALILILLLSACGPTSASGTSGTPLPVEPAHATAAPSAPAETRDDAMAPTPAAIPADAVHITWILGKDSGQPAMMQRDLDVLAVRLGKNGWPVHLDVLPMEAEGHPETYATDAFVTGTGYAAQLYNDGITLDAARLATKETPVLVEKYADLIQPAAISLQVKRDVGRACLALYMKQDKAPGDWLVTPPAMSDIVSWTENNDVRIGKGSAGITTPMPFVLSMQAWAAEQGYYNLGILKAEGGFYARINDPVMQPLPLESISGFDTMYGRLVALFNAGKLFDMANLSADTDGFISWFPYGQYDAFCQADSITGMDVVAIPLRGIDWRRSSKAPEAVSVMAIPVNNQRGAQALKLAEWALTSREGYDLMTYGERDKDYTLVADRVAPTVPDKKASFVSGNGLFVWDIAMDRLTIADPANAADLLGSDNSLLLPYANYAKAQEILAGGENSVSRAVTAVAQDNIKLISDRNHLLMGLMPAADPDSDETQPVTNAVAALKLLRALDTDHAVDRLAEAYAAELLKLTKE